MGSQRPKADIKRRELQGFSKVPTTATRYVAHRIFSLKFRCCTNTMEFTTSSPFTIPGLGGRESIVLRLQAPGPASAEQRFAWSAMRGRHGRIHPLLAGPEDPSDDSGKLIPPALVIQDSDTESIPASSPPTTPTDTAPETSLLALALAKDEEMDEDLSSTGYRNRAPYPHASTPFRPRDATIRQSHKPLDTHYPISSQGYTTKIQIWNQPDDVPEKSSIFCLLIDTGDTEAFCFAEDYMLLTKGEERSPKYSRQPLTGMEKGLTNHPVLSPYAYYSGFERQLCKGDLSNERLRDLAPFGRLRYADETMAEVCLLGPLFRCSLKAFDGLAGRNQKYDLVFDMRFLGAISATFELLRDPSDGVLGVAPSDTYLRVGRGQPSFLHVMSTKINRHQVDFIGISMFFVLRLPPQYYTCYPARQRAIDSWMAFNTWPFATQPPWSRTIDVISHTGRRANAPPAWIVRLRSLTVERVPAQRQRPVLSEDTTPYLHLNFVNNDCPDGLEMLIDTGCSTSELPQNAIQRLHEVLGRRTTTVPKPSRDPNRRETYHVSTWVLDNKSQVKFEFGGDPDEPPIIVYGPTETFVYPDEMLPGAGENNRLEGLIFPMVEDKKHGILGLNFFQSMFVAMSKAENGWHHVRLAAQWPENHESDLKAFALPKETNY